MKFGTKTAFGDLRGGAYNKNVQGQERIKPGAHSAHLIMTPKMENRKF